MRKRNFTLIELLVVIAIIVILAAILLPALQSARMRAQSTTCISNMKQVGTTAQQYISDNRGFWITGANGTQRYDKNIKDPDPACRGTFGGRRKAVRDRLALQGGTGDFP